MIGIKGSAGTLRRFRDDPPPPFCNLLQMSHFHRAPDACEKLSEFKTETSQEGVG